MSPIKMDDNTFMLKKRLCILICSSLFLLSGCGVATEDKMPSESTEASQETIINIPLQETQPVVETVSEEDKQAIFGDTKVLEGTFAYWPEDEVGSLPELTSGDLTSTLIKGQETVIVTYENCDYEVIKTYLSGLETLGYNKESLIETKKDLLAIYQLGDQKVNLSYTNQLDKHQVTILVKNATQ